MSTQDWKTYAQEISADKLTYAQVANIVGMAIGLVKIEVKSARIKMTKSGELS